MLLGADLGLALVVVGFDAVVAFGSSIGILESSSNSLVCSRSRVLLIRASVCCSCSLVCAEIGSCISPPFEDTSMWGFLWPQALMSRPDRWF